MSELIMKPNLIVKWSISDVEAIERLKNLPIDNLTFRIHLWIDNRKKGIKFEQNDII